MTLVALLAKVIFYKVMTDHVYCRLLSDNPKTIK